MSFFSKLIGYLSTIIQFKDINVKEALLASSDINPDSTREITYQEASNNNVGWDVINTAINGSTIIKYFNELKYFRIGTIPNNFLKNCTNLEEIEFPETLTIWTVSNGYNILDNTKIKKLDLSHFTELKTNAVKNLFGVLNYLEEVDISNLQIISGIIFRSTKQPNITKVKIGSVNQLFNLQYNDAGEHIIVYPWCSKKASFYIGDNLVRDFTVPNDITKINDYLFYYIHNVNTITIHSNCTTCGKYSFAGLDENTSIIGLGNIVNIGDYSFKECRAQGISNVPNNVTYIGREAYIGSSIYCIDSSTLQTIDYNAFEGSDITYIKANNCILLKAADNNTTLYAIFRSCKSLVSVEMNSLTVIPPDTFTNCTALTTVKMQSVTTMYGGFNSCTNLTTVDMPAVVYTGKRVFSGCNKLDNTISNKFTIDLSNMEHIGIESFKNCSLLVCPSDFSDNLTYIGDSAFKGCILPSTQTYVIIRTNNNGVGATYETYSSGGYLMYNSPFPCTQNTTTGAITAGVSKIYVPAATLTWYANNTEWAALCAKTGLQFDDIVNIPI